MNFEEYWKALFPPGRDICFVVNQAGDRFPIQAGDKKVAEHFWNVCGHECMKEVTKGFKEMSGKLVVIYPNGTTTEEEYIGDEPSLQTLQGHIQGYIEADVVPPHGIRFFWMQCRVWSGIRISFA